MKDKKFLSGRFKEEARWTAIVAIKLAGKGYEKVSTAWWRLTAPKAEKEKHAAYEKQQAEMRAVMDEMRAAELRDCVRDVNEFLFAHPAASASGHFSDVGWPEERDTNAQVAVASALHALHVLSHKHENEIEFTKSGDFVVNGEKAAEVAIAQIVVFLDSADRQKDAKALWSWVYDLAATGKAPHLIPGMKIKVAENGNLIVCKNKDVTQNNPSPSELWAHDKKAALLAATAKQPQPGNRR